MTYASALLTDPAAVYRQIDVVGRTAMADGPALVQLLYEELISALRSAAWATEHGQLARKSERVTRATAILFALEAGLDFENGGEMSITFAASMAARASRSSRPRWSGRAYLPQRRGQHRRHRGGVGKPCAR